MMLILKRRYGLIGLILLGQILGWVAAEGRPAFEHKPLVNLTGYDCGGCHHDIFKQWRDSVHASSSPTKDRIHGYFYQQMVGSPFADNLTFQQAYPVCLQCHAPVAAQQGQTNLSRRPAFQDGVNCVTCHTMKAYKGRLDAAGKTLWGSTAYDFSTTHLQGVSGRYADPHPSPVAKTIKSAYHPFPIEPNQALLKTADACLGCHNMDIVSAPDPSADNDSINETIACQHCHMPKVDGIADHGMHGGHDEGMLQRALLMSMRLDTDTEPQRLQLSLKNTLPHAFPGAQFLRYLVVKISVYDAQGQIVWQNATNNAYEVDRQSVLGYPYRLHVDFLANDSHPATPEDKSLSPPLKPYESRRLSYDLPNKQFVLIRAEATYHLASPQQLQNDPYARDMPLSRLAALSELRL